MERDGNMNDADDQGRASDGQGQESDARGRGFFATASQDGRIPVTGEWIIAAPRSAVHAVISDFASMPRNFPKVARAMRVIDVDGPRLRLEPTAASFGRLFPEVKIAIDAEIIPDGGYRCRTHNITFNTRGEEELLLFDHPGGTRIAYTYFVDVRCRALTPLYAWMVRTFALRFWERAVIDELRKILQESAGGK